MTDLVNHPPHYTEHPSGIECIQVTEHMNFCLGNAIKYIWRAGAKGNPIEDLEKARWYIDRELRRLENGQIEEGRQGEDMVVHDGDRWVPGGITTLSNGSAWGWDADKKEWVRLGPVTRRE